MFKRGLSVVACALALAVALETEAQRRLTAPILNGITIPGGASPVGLVLGANLEHCTGTLIGCRTVLTAAHCITAPPMAVFFQHLGVVAVENVAVHPGYVPLSPSNPPINDLALLRLAAPAANLPLAAINIAGRVPHGTPAQMIGFGRALGGPAGGDPTVGVMRFGQTFTAPCQGDHGFFNVCGYFEAPVGPAGEHSGICQGDSGGPLFAGGRVVGVTSAFFSQTGQECRPPSYNLYADVFLGREWISTAAGNDFGSQCTGPRVGESGVTVGFAEDRVVAGVSHDYEIIVPAGSGELRVTLMAEASADADLVVGRSGNAQCSSAFESPLPEVCIIDNPAPGAWELEVSGFAGAGTYQLVATTIAAPATTSCTPGPNTLCIDSSPGDRRFKAEVTYSTVQGGGASGQASAVPLAAVGASAGGLFTFFNPSNPELMLKILNACVPPFNRYWIFYAATTNVGFTVRVTDTVTGNTWTRTNPDQTPALPVQDTDALPCS